MSGRSSSVATWFSRLAPVTREMPAAPGRPDDPRLGNIMEIWHGDPSRLHPGRAVLMGFPQDEGVRRNQGRAGAAAAPAALRRALAQLCTWDGASDTDLAQMPPLDAGDVRITGNLEETQLALADVVAGIMAADAVPVVLGGGHEAAFGHFLGYVNLGRPVGIINIDAHLDVRPLLNGLGHSGSPFRQALEHPASPLAGGRYVCLGANPHAASRSHVDYLRQHGARLFWADQVRQSLPQVLSREISRLAQDQCHIYVTVDADVVNQAEVPGVSAPNAAGLPGEQLLRACRLAGKSRHVASFDLVEINPLVDQDGTSIRWAGLAIWQFLIGLANREKQEN